MCAFGMEASCWKGCRGRTTSTNCVGAKTGVDPCRIEMPEFEAIDEARKADGFAIIAVNKVACLADIQGFRDGRMRQYS
jgi:hypothetical protein